jgi:hypothetical protein
MLLREGNLSQEYARTRLGDAVDLAQARGNLLPGNHQQYAVANDHGSALIGQGELISEALLRVQARAAEYGDFLVGGEQADGGSSAGAFGHSEQGTVSAADVYEVIAGVKLDRLDNAFVDEASNLPLPAPQGQIVRIASVLRGFAAVFHVVVGAGDRRRFGL